VAYSRKGTAGDASFNSAGFKDDVRGFFGSGTSLQELYIQPGRLTRADWAVLAKAAKWARSRAGALVDTHWIGGDPSRLQVYGYASWSPREGTVMLRNPDDRPQEISLDAASVFELPAGAPQRYVLSSPYKDQRLRRITLRAGQPEQVTLAPFEVLVFDEHGI